MGRTSPRPDPRQILSLWNQSSGRSRWQPAVKVTDFRMGLLIDAFEDSGRGGRLTSRRELHRKARKRNALQFSAPSFASLNRMCHR